VQLDWFTFFAQVANFVILVALLRRFLYRPVSAAIDRRQREIGERVDAAEEERRAAREEADQLRRQQEQLAERRSELVAAAEEEVKDVRTRLLEEARKEADQARQEWQRAVAREQEAVLSELRERAVSEMYASLRVAMSDLAGGELEDRIVEVLLQRLADLGEDERAKLVSAARTAEGRVTVASRSPLSEETRERLEEALGRVIGRTPLVRYQTGESVVSGVEITVGDRKLGWSLGSYVSRVEDRVGELLGAPEKEPAGGVRPKDTP
jgi:F-type H+-transporting ATPase subunit b